MIYNVSLNELLSEIEKLGIEEKFDDVPGKILVRFKNLVDIGRDSFDCKMHSVMIVYEEKTVKAVVLYLISNPTETQSLWTYILNYGFLELELYPIMIEEESMPTKLFLAPIKY